MRSLPATTTRGACSRSLSGGERPAAALVSRLFCPKWPLPAQGLDQDVHVEQREGPVLMPLRTIWAPLSSGVRWPTGAVSLPTRTRIRLSFTVPQLQTARPTARPASFR